VKTSFEETDIIAECIKAPNKFVSIPAGAARPALNRLDYIQALPVEFHQRFKPLCAVNSLMSALSLFGDTIAVQLLLRYRDGIMETGSSLRESEVMRDFSARPGDGRLDERVKAIWKLISTNCKMYASRLIYQQRCESVAAALESLAGQHDLLLVQLIGSDGSINHAVTIVRHSSSLCIVDSNERFAVPLTDAALAAVNRSAACTGWKAVIKMTPKEKLLASKARIFNCRLAA
jgi:hypothetical protein